MYVDGAWGAHCLNDIHAFWRWVACMYIDLDDRRRSESLEQYMESPRNPEEGLCTCSPELRKSSHSHGVWHSKRKLTAM